jgi:hypothetical protein
MLENLLAGSSHDEQVAGTRPEVARAAAAQRPHQERSGSSEGNDCHDRVVQVAQFPVGMKSHAVATVAVVVEARANEPDVVELRQVLAHHRQRGSREIVAWAVPPTETGLVDNALVHEPTVVTPRYGSDQLLAKRVSAE